jgi:hypothetical protein
MPNNSVVINRTINEYVIERFIWKESTFDLTRKAQNLAFDNLAPVMHSEHP